MSAAACPGVPEKHARASRPPPRLIAARAKRPDPLPPLALADVQESITKQLAAHGVAGTPLEDGARGAARNAVAVVWVHYQEEHSLRLEAEARIAELEEQLEQRRCAWATHAWEPEPTTGAHRCSRCGAIGGGVR